MAKRFFSLALLMVFSIAVAPCAFAGGKAISENKNDDSAQTALTNSDGTANKEDAGESDKQAEDANKEDDSDKKDAKEKLKLGWVAGISGGLVSASGVTRDFINSHKKSSCAAVLIAIAGVLYQYNEDFRETVNDFLGIEDDEEDYNCDLNA